MQMWQMKSSRKRHRVKAGSVSISSSFSCARLTATLNSGCARHSGSNLCVVNTVQIIVFLPVLRM